MTDVTQDRDQAGAELSAADEQVLRELTERARAGGLKLTGEGGLLGKLTKMVIEGALEGELDDHLGYGKHDPEGRDGGNSRNGRRAKTILTEAGPVEISVPRDRDSSFEPKIVAKRQRRLTGVEDMVISLSAKGLTHGEIAAHLAEVYGAEVSKQTITAITDRVMEGLAEWQSRPLDAAWFPANVANYGVACWWSHRRMSWRGVLSLRQYRGRSLSSAATRASCSAVQICRSVPLGKYWRRRPLVFSLLPRCQGECGSAK
jgi:Transposase, Mutator family